MSDYESSFREKLRRHLFQMCLVAMVPLTAHILIPKLIKKLMLQREMRNSVLLKVLPALATVFSGLVSFVQGASCALSLEKKITENVKHVSTNLPTDVSFLRQLPPDLRIKPTTAMAFINRAPVITKGGVILFHLWPLAGAAGLWSPGLLGVAGCIWVGTPSR